MKRTKSARKKRATGRQRSAGNRPVARRPKTKHGKKTTRRKRPAAARRRVRAPEDFEVPAPPETRGLGSEAGGQSGDTEGLSRAELADSESVEELVEEGQAFEAGVISGVEDAPEPDAGEIRTRQVPEDDVPEEYLNKE